jgi:hypothetical protein
MRDSVRRLCSPLTESKASPIASTGTRSDSQKMNEGSGSRDVVKNLRNRNGSSATVSLICWLATKTVPTAISITISSRMMKRMLVR